MVGDRRRRGDPVPAADRGGGVAGPGGPRYRPRRAARPGARVGEPALLGLRDHGWQAPTPGPAGTGGCPWAVQRVGAAAGLVRVVDLVAGGGADRDGGAGHLPHGGRPVQLGLRAQPGHGVARRPVGVAARHVRRRTAGARAAAARRRRTPGSAARAPGGRGRGGRAPADTGRPGHRHRVGRRLGRPADRASGARGGGRQERGRSGLHVPLPGGPAGIARSRGAHPGGAARRGVRYDNPGRCRRGTRERAERTAAGHPRRKGAVADRFRGGRDRRRRVRHRVLDHRGGRVARSARPPDVGSRARQRRRRGPAGRRPGVRAAGRAARRAGRPQAR